MCPYLLINKCEEVLPGPQGAPLSSKELVWGAVRLAVGERGIAASHATIIPVITTAVLFLLAVCAVGGLLLIAVCAVLCAHSSIVCGTT